MITRRPGCMIRMREHSIFVLIHLGHAGVQAAERFRRVEDPRLRQKTHLHAIINSVDGSTVHACSQSLSVIGQLAVPTRETAAASRHSKSRAWIALWTRSSVSVDGSALGLDSESRFICSESVYVEGEGLGDVAPGAWADASGVGGAGVSGACTAVGGAKWQLANEVLPVFAGDGVRVATGGAGAVVDMGLG